MRDSYTCLSFLCELEGVIQRIATESWLVSSDDLSEAYVLLAVRTCRGKHLLNQLDIIDDVTLYVSCCLYVCRVMESVSGSLHNKSIVSLVQAEKCI